MIIWHTLTFMVCSVQKRPDHNHSTSRQQALLNHQGFFSIPKLFAIFTITFIENNIFFTITEFLLAFVVRFFLCLSPFGLCWIWMSLVALGRNMPVLNRFEDWVFTDLTSWILLYLGPRSECQCGILGLDWVHIVVVILLVAALAWLADISMRAKWFSRLFNQLTCLHASASMAIISNLSTTEGHTIEEAWDHLLLAFSHSGFHHQ